MKKKSILIITLLFAALLVIIIASDLKEDRWTWLAHQKSMYMMTEKEVDKILPRLNRRFPDFNERIKAFSILRLGTPYDLKCLAEEKPPETGPIFRVDTTNCTVLVLTNSALAHASSFKEARWMMRYLNYYPVPEGEDPIFYENRRHYTADRILTSPYFHELTRELAQPGELDSVTIILNRKADGSHFLPLDWEKEITMAYFPLGVINAEFMKRLPGVCGVGFVKKSYFEKGIVIAHEGMIVDQKDLIHASMADGKAIRVNFLDYLFKRDKPIHDGIILWEFVEVKQKQHKY
ncbi:DUF1460 domain-containing protein [candidate division KSB1 bacterium]|nr:DUF1460 domain-containing protein [candidate division KSB1 bacterium]